MRSLDALLDELYSGQERMSRDEIYRRAVAARLPASAVSALDALPEGEYAQDEVVAALAELGGGISGRSDGVPAELLSAQDLCRELAHLHRTRHDTFLHGSAQALAHHTQRMNELEVEYLRRYPEREVDPRRLRPVRR